MLVKICGICSAADALDAVDPEADRGAVHVQGQVVRLADGEGLGVAAEQGGAVEVALQPPDVVDVVVAGAVRVVADPGVPAAEDAFVVVVGSGQRRDVGFD